MSNSLKERRLELGLTMLQVAKAVGVFEATVSRWESGDIANMRRDKIAKLAHALKLRPSAVIEIDDDSFSNTSKCVEIPVLGNFVNRDDSDVGEYIKTLRIKYGYSQEQLGAMIGVKRAAVQKWESGTVKNLKRETIKKLGEIFNVSPSMFICNSFDNEIFSLTSHEEKLIVSYRKQPEMQAAVDKLLGISKQDIEYIPGALR